MYAVSRIIAAVARQHLLPPVLARVHGRFGTPHVATILSGVATAVIALFTGVVALRCCAAVPLRRCAAACIDARRACMRALVAFLQLTALPRFCCRRLRLLLPPPPPLALIPMMQNRLRVSCFP